MSHGRRRRLLRCDCSGIVACTGCGSRVYDVRGLSAPGLGRNRYKRGSGHPVLMLFEEMPARRVSGNGHPILTRFGRAMDFGAFPDGGGYPLGFLEKAYGTLGVTDPDQVLHLCSGSMRRGIRVDVRLETKPTVVADCRRTPFPDGSFRWIMADPPYGESYAEDLYKTKPWYPRPGQILREAARLLQPGGRFGLLHFIPPPAAAGLEFVGLWAVSTGAGYALRAWSVYEKPAAGLFAPAEGSSDGGGR